MFKTEKIVYVPRRPQKFPSGPLAVTLWTYNKAIRTMEPLATCQGDVNWTESLSSIAQLCKSVYYGIRNNFGSIFIKFSGAKFHVFHGLI